MAFVSSYLNINNDVQISRENYEIALSATSLATSILIEADKEVNVHKHPNGVYYVRFTWKGTAVNRSCKTKDRRLALKKAKQIRADYITRHSLGQPTASAETKERKLKDVIKLYKRFGEESDEAPTPDTAKKYLQQLSIWIKVLDASTVTELHNAVQDHSLKKENARRKRLELQPLSKGGYASSLRGAAAVFSKEARKFYKRKGVYIENPFSGKVPKGKFEKFLSPPGGLGFIDELFEAAVKELSQAPQMFPIFLLALGAGLRAQEATHVSWKHVLENGIKVRNDEIHKTKSDEPRTVPAGSSLSDRLLALKPEDASPEDFVVPDIRKRTTGSGIYKKRCDRALKKLNKWLREHGVTEDLTSHPTHYLRKLFGASIFTRYENGLQLAKNYLGHSTAEITERIYVDLLETPEVDVLPKLRTKTVENHE